MGNVPAYPKILTNSNWQKHKGIIAKLVKGETGIGPALTKLERDYNAIEWQYFNPLLGGKLPKPRTLEDLKERLDGVDDRQDDVTALSRQARALSQKCKTLGDKWERSSVVPKATRVHVQVGMVRALNALADELDDVDHAPFYDKLRKELASIAEQSTKLLSSTRQKLERGILAVERSPTGETYNEEVYQLSRALGAIISKLPEFKALYKLDWEDVVNSDQFDDEAPREEVLERVNHLYNALRRLKSAQGIH